MEDLLGIETAQEFSFFLFIFQESSLSFFTTSTEGMQFPVEIFASPPPTF
jgi:hypothetical protein